MIALDWTMHMNSAFFACVASDQRARVDYGKLVAVLDHRNLLGWRDSNDGEGGIVRLPALRTAAGVIVRNRDRDSDLHRAILAMASEYASRE